jgi:uncharacterized protein with von Willebrand factor type A (vWA) domain
VQKTTRFVLLMAALVVVFPAAARAQEGQPAPAVAQAASQSEADQLRQRIAQIQRQAMQDPALKPAEDSFEAVLQAAMARLDPQAPAKTARALTLNREVEAARAASDNAKLNQLAEEATALKAYFDALRPRALAEADVQAARQAYLARVLERMKQIDLNTQQYVDRLAELQRGGSPQSGAADHPR